MILGLGDSVFSRKLVELNLKRQFLFRFSLNVFRIRLAMLAMFTLRHFVSSLN